MTNLFYSFFGSLNSLVFPLITILCVILPILLAVAFLTILERKQLAAHQRRVGPNTTGLLGTLQPFADAVKLILKENIVPAHSNKIMFYVAPIITLICSLLGWSVIPFGDGLAIAELPLSVLYTLAISSLGFYGVLFAGWAANSKYAFLGSLRSTAAVVSYELLLSSIILVVVVINGALNYTLIVENQLAVLAFIPLLPLSLIFFIAILAETARTPFDLQEAKLILKIWPL